MQPEWTGLLESNWVGHAFGIAIPPSVLAQFLQVFRRRTRISEVYNDLVELTDSPLAAIFEAGAREYEDLRNLRISVSSRRSAELGDDEVETILLAMERVQGEAHSKLSETTTFLATTANTAPFLGLLGTIWGVMDTFSAVASAKHPMALPS